MCVVGGRGGVCLLRATIYSMLVSVRYATVLRSVSRPAAVRADKTRALYRSSRSAARFAVVRRPRVVRAPAPAPARRPILSLFSPSQ
jgi:hypothetical protein